MEKLLGKWIGISLVLAARAAVAASPLLYVPHADVAGLTATAVDGVVHVRWQTTTELGIQTFSLLGRPQRGTVLRPVGAARIPAHDDEAGGAYDQPDVQAAPGASWHYELHLAANASDAPIATWDGTIVAARIAAAASSATPAASGVVALGTTASTMPICWIGAGPRVQAWTNSLPADRVRLSLRYEGVYRVTVQELATAMGVTVTVISNALAQTNLCLTCQGAPVSWTGDATGTNLFFYGLAPATHDAPENVYWVSLASGAAMPTSTFPPALPGITNIDFLYRIEQQGTDYLNRVSRTALVGPTVPDTTFNGLLYPSSNPLQKTVPLTAAGGGSWTGRLVVRLLSCCDVPDNDNHQARVTLGGSTVGTTNWDGEQYLEYDIPFPSANLSAGNQATIAVQNTGTSYTANEYAADSSRFLWASYAIVYPRLYQATNDALRCTGGTGDTVCVTGFATNDLVAFDITDPNQAVIMGAATVSRSATNSATWQIAFSAGGTDRVYAVFSRSAGCLQPSVRGVRDVNWTASANAADEVMLIPPEGWCPGFRQALQPLADFRNAQGLKTTIVDVESIYNAYSYGLVDTAAIRTFVSDGYTTWGAHPLKYLLLAGSGTMDYKHLTFSVNSASACLLPTVQAGQRYPGTPNFDGWILACDQALGDVAGDAAPEVIVGRIPTTKTQDIATVVQKTIAYEGSWPKKPLTAVGADWDNTGDMYYPFQESTDQILHWLVSAGRTVTNLYPSLDPVDPGNLAMNRVYSLFPSLQAGASLMSFFGHTDEQNFGGGDGKLLRNADISSANWQRPPILIGIGCRVNRWQSMSATVVIEPLGLLTAGTGFTAAIGPTGFFLADDGANLSAALFAAVAQKDTVRLGDLLRVSLQQMAPSMTVGNLQSVSIIGDPALVYRHDVTALGTPVSWLTQYGMTAPNADASNTVANGWSWPVWQSYHAGISPFATNEVRITRAQTNPTAAATNRMTVAFTSASNRTFRLVYKDSLLATDDWRAVSWAQTNGLSWFPVGTLISAAGPITAVDAPIESDHATQGFFRVQLVP